MFRTASKKSENKVCESSSKTGRKQYERTKKLVVLSLLSAISYLSVYLVDFRVQFLSFDIKDAFITVSAMIFGPVSGVVMSLVVSFIEMIFISSTGWYGFLMNFISSAVFAGIAALIYKYRRTKAGSYIALVSSVFATTAVMMIANLIVTPFYSGMTASEVAGLIPTFLFPFNLIKSVVNAALTFILYKPVSTVLKRAGIISRTNDNMTRAASDSQQSAVKSPANVKYTVLTSIGAIIIIIASMLIFVFVMHGDLSFFK